LTAVQTLVSARGLAKSFGGFVALHETDFEVTAGEVRALIGSNGAGKSTLVKILTGAIAPSRGTVDVCGERVTSGLPSEMIRRGVACIYQHSNLVPAMTVLDNLFLGRQPTRRLGLVDTARQRREATQLLQRYGIDLDLDAVVAGLPTVKQKEVEIAKALALDARVLLMDEPTGWLAAADVARLHDTVRLLKSRGVGIVYISHILDEIFAVCDTITIMRDGRVVHDGKVADIDRARVVTTMVGDRLAEASAKAAGSPRRPGGTGRARLSCAGLGKNGVFTDVTFDLFAGEILCITGLIGSKRTELLHCLYGSDRFDSGSLTVDGRQVAFRSPASAIAAGIGFVSEDRHREGLMLGLTIAENLALTALGAFRRAGFLDRRGMARMARGSIESLGIRPPDPNRTVRLLSGGNQQKVYLGKWLHRRPDILILDEPTVGVDVGAKAEIYELLRAERDRGAGILVVSSDLEEVMTIADRIAVMSAGRLVAIHEGGVASNEQLVREIVGGYA
jgi:ABC-type sugar transport system ATPase subunit